VALQGLAVVGQLGKNLARSGGKNVAVMFKPGSDYGLVVSDDLAAQRGQDARQRLDAQTPIAFRQRDGGNGLRAGLVDAGFVLQPAH